MSVNRIEPHQPEDGIRAPVPYFIHLEPVAQVAAGATATVTYTIGPRPFVWTHMGFASEEVGFPATGQRFKVNLQDVGGSTFFAPVRWLMSCVNGNHGTNDKAMIELAVPWRFDRMSSLIAEFENMGALAATPYLVLHGYLD